MNFRAKSSLTALLLVLTNAAPVWADTLQTYKLTGITDNGASVSGTLTFDLTKDAFIAPSSVKVTGESGTYNTFNAAKWNGTYGNIADSNIIPAPSATTLFVNLADATDNLYLQFKDTNGVLSLARASDVGFYNLKDHFASSTLTAVPEPEIISMFAIGLLGLGLARKKIN
jgi:hypothetical protein